jgi:signal transduction histidine kinase
MVQHNEVPGGARRLLSVSVTRQTVLWLACLAVLVTTVGWLSNMVLSGAVERAVYRGAISTSERWATFFAENMPRLANALAGKVDEEQVAYVHSVEKMGDVFRFKLFDGEGRLVFVSDEVEKLLAGEALPVEEEPFARTVLKDGVPFAEVADGTGKTNRPPLYAEAYVPVKDATGKVLGVAEVYVDQTEAEAQIRSAFYGLGLALAALAGLAVAVPGFAFLWRNQQALRASRKAAELEAANLEMERAQSAELGAHNEQLIGLNKELAARMKELGEAHDELVKKGRMEQLGQLTATVAHELRNPLGAVRTSTFLLERKLKGKGLGVDAQIERINHGVIRCDAIITQLLDFSRSRQLNCKPGDLDQWLAQVLDEEARKLPAAVTITCQMGLDGRDVPFDPARLQRAVINLVSNACEALVGQGDDPAKFARPDPVISVSTCVRENGAVIEVKDNGPGIPAEVMARIREPLFTTKSFGTGLGVPAVEQIALQHKGKLEIASVAGHGATFSIWLPFAVEDNQEEAA